MSDLPDDNHLSAPLSGVEKVKMDSNWLRGAIAMELQTEVPKFGNDTQQILKFHGIYAQDDRDGRAQRRRSGLDVEHICMIRVALPGGTLTAAQYLALSDLADKLGNGTIRLTTRQGIQFHFVTKADLAELLRAINSIDVTTWGGCGDVVRNVTACPGAVLPLVGEALSDIANALSQRYKAPAASYLELWVDNERVPTPLLDARSQQDSLYGANLLPRKFKIGVSTSGDNCVDVLSCDLGVVLDAQSLNRIRLYVGGGMGRSGTDDTTYAKLGELLGEVDQSELLGICDAVIALQRDHGNRVDRAHARLKYLIDAWGIDRFREQVEARANVHFAPAGVDTFLATSDHLGVTRLPHHVLRIGLKTPSGRIADTGQISLKSGIYFLVSKYQPKLAVTAKGDLLLEGIDEASLGEFLLDLKLFGIKPSSELPSLARTSFACVALPTCGLALGESERYLPSFIEELTAALESNGVGDLEIDIRITGCPNGCARPYLGEIGIVARTKKSYDIFLGADSCGTRLNHLFARDVAKESLIAALVPILKLYSEGRHDQERFGDFVARLEPQQLAALTPVATRRPRSLAVATP